jgi:hypothetical protein
MNCLVKIIILVLINGTLYGADWRQEKTPGDVMKNMQEVYPDQTYDHIQIHIKNSANQHDFLRSFSAYFYGHLRNIKNNYPVISRLYPYQGWIGGDAHVENFGALVGDRGKGLFAFNDYDDVALGPFVADILRLATSATMVDKNISLKDFIHKYHKGLKGKVENRCSTIQKMIERADEKGQTIDAEEVEEGKFTTFMEPHRKITPEELLVAQQTVNKLWKDEVPILDAYIFTKDHGGSFGKKRFELLVTLNKRPARVELKELEPSSVRALTGEIDLNYQRRLNVAKMFYLNGKLDESLNLIEMEGKTYLQRFRWAGNKILRVESLGQQDLRPCLLDEAYLLGQMHRQNLMMLKIFLKAYSDLIEGFSEKDWQSVVDELYTRINKAYQLVK